MDKARQSLAKGNKSVLLVSPAGSGKSVVIAAIAKSVADKSGHVLFLVHRKELVDQITNTFKTAEIPGDSFTAMTVGKIVHRFDVLPKPTLIITDESHHALAATYQKIYQHYADVPRLGFTATPWRLNGDGLGDIYQDMVEGPSVKWLIENHFLAPFHYWGATEIDKTKLRKRNGEYTNKSMDDAFGKFVFGDTIEQYRKHSDSQQAIVYAYSVEFSEKVAAAFNAAGITAVHADAKTPKRERAEIMTGFKHGDIKILCNVDLISEGYDVPDCNTIIMLRPTKSLVLDVQQSMRGMRYRPGKEAQIIDQVGNFKEFGLPDADREWTLSARPKKKRDGEIPPQTCEQCLATFYEWARDDEGALVCPECGAPKPVSEPGDNSKERVDAELIDLSTEEGRKQALAAQSPYGKSWMKALSIIKTQMDVGKRKNGNPLYSLAIIMTRQGLNPSPKDMDDVATAQDTSLKSVEVAIRWAQKTIRKNNSELTYNF